MQKATGILILIVSVWICIAVVCAGCVTPAPSHNTSESCVCECGTPATVPTENIKPLVTTPHRPDSYWITINPLANITSGATIIVGGETTLPVDTQLLVQVLPPFRHHDKAHSRDLEGNMTVVWVNPGNTSGVNTWGVLVNTTGYVRPYQGTERCEVSVFPYYKETWGNATSFYVNGSID